MKGDQEFEGRRRSVQVGKREALGCDCRAGNGGISIEFGGNEEQSEGFQPSQRTSRLSENWASSGGPKLGW
jgi:hypothetical protein